VPLVVSHALQLGFSMKKQLVPRPTLSIIGITWEAQKRKKNNLRKIIVKVIIII